MNDLENGAKRLKEIVEENIQKIQDAQMLIKENEADLVLIKLKDNSIKILELNDTIKKLNVRVENESKNVIEKKSNKRKLKFESHKTKSQELGFTDIDAFYNFKHSFKEFTTKFKDLAEGCNKVAKKMMDYSRNFEEKTEQINERINSKAQQEINVILDKRIQAYIELQEEITGKKFELSTDTLGKLVTSMISPNEKFFSIEEIRDICTRRDMIVEIMSKEGRERDTIVKKEIEKRLQNKPFENLIEEKTEEKEKKEKEHELDIDQDEDSIELKESLEKVKEEISNGQLEEENDEEWKERRKNLQAQVRTIEKEIRDRKTAFNNRKKELKKEIEKIEKEIKKLENEKTAEEKKIARAYEEIINVISLWKRGTNDVLIPPLLHIKSQIDKESNEI